ncbi:MAG: succinate dehydrogenase iron-sulfur subunit [Methanobacteriota archaeon]|nr:MAG: succinate dehydrogenase iron-sulfur subunit [Euryarchaeota archaeon]
MTEGELLVKIQRFDPTVDRQPYWQSYRVDIKAGMTVLDALFEILNHQDGTLSFRYCCRAGVCGSCAMVIGGKIRLACETQVGQFMGRKELLLSPLPHQKVVKDLAVDYEHFFDRMKQTKPYLIGQEPYPEKEYVQTPKQREPINEPIDCIMCGACTSSCTVAWTNSEYLGPAALMKAYRFYADTRDIAKDERLDIIESENGVYRCHTIFNCVEVCPKKLNPTETIQRLKIKAAKRRLFGRRRRPRS